MDNHTLIIVDFNAHSPTWAPNRDTGDDVGDKIDELLLTEDLMVLNDPEVATRLSCKSNEKDTTPDLSIAKSS